MARIAFTSLLALHGAIHLLGFAKGLRLAEVASLKRTSAGTKTGSPRHRRGRRMPLHRDGSASELLRAGVAAALLCAAVPATAGGLRPDSGGIEIDLLPLAASAAAGEAGGALQLWVAAERNRLRLVGAHLHYPAAVVPSPFEDRSATVAAVLYDRFFRDDYTGPWLAAGAEYWWSRIGSRNGDAGTWGTPVATVGAGWVFAIWRGLYLNPWAAAHAPLASSGVQVGAERYHPRALEAEVSLKIGWRVEL